MNAFEKQLVEALQANTPRATIDRLREGIAALPDSRLKTAAQERLNEAAALIDEQGNVGNVWFFDRITEDARRTAREAVFLPLLQRDRDRQNGTRKPKRPEIDAWIDGQLKRNGAAKSPALWQNAPDWITDQIGFDRFAKRVTKARKRAASK